MEDWFVEEHGQILRANNIHLVACTAAVLMITIYIDTQKSYTLLFQQHFRMSGNKKRVVESCNIVNILWR